MERNLLMISVTSLMPVLCTNALSSKALSHYTLMHSEKMDGKQFLKKLMAAAHENPNSLAATLRRRSLQSQIQRFIDGHTMEPRRSTLQPVADHYGVSVEAFYVASIAKQIAIERGLLSETGLQRENASQATNLVGEERPRQFAAATTLVSGGNQLPQLVIELGRELKNIDPEARKPIVAAITEALERPEKAVFYSEMISAMLPVKQSRTA